MFVCFGDRVSLISGWLEIAQGDSQFRIPLPLASSIGIPGHVSMADYVVWRSILSGSLTPALHTQTQKFL